ncbi:MAG: hypothetical protein K2H74_03725 [Paramuribaculum sp.]|nr:hypothetical protein [Paramuribaculum sp.]
MKKSVIILGALLCAASMQTYASDLVSGGIGKKLGVTVPTVEGQEESDIIFDVSDPAYDWTQTDSKKIKVEIKGDGLVMESKEEDGVAFTIAELPIDIEEGSEFMFGVTLLGPKLDDKKSLGIIFDYEDARNYKALAIYKKQFDYFVVKDGTVSSVKTGLVKMKGNTYTIVMTRENGKVEFKLNDLEICTLKKVSITNAMFGAFIHGKMKALMPCFYMHNADHEDTEQSTTD